MCQASPLVPVGGSLGSHTLPQDQSTASSKVFNSGKKRTSAKYMGIPPSWVLTLAH